jgi:acetyl esterase
MFATAVSASVAPRLRGRLPLAAGALPRDRGAPVRVPVPGVAALHLRSRGGVLPATVTWPATADGRPPALVVFFADVARPDRFTSALAECAVVLTVVVHATPYDAATTAFDDASAVLGWSADHAGELDADPDRLVVAGHAGGAALAAAVALHARDQWWPAVAGQLLIEPDLDAWPASVPYASSLRETPLDGAPPATVVTGRRDDGAFLAERLRTAGVAVDELIAGADAPPDLGRTLRALV